MVPEGWIYTALSKVMEFKNGLNFTKSDQGEEIKIVGVSNFKDYSELRSTEHLDVVRVAQSIRDGELLKDGDLLFVRSNGNKDLIGRCLFFPEVRERIAYSGFTIRGRVNDTNLLPEYLSNVARSPIMKQQISRNGGGTNISNLSQQILGDISVALPPLLEQRRITQILSTWDQAITATERMLENSQQRKKGLMQQLLTGKKRLPGFEGEWKAKPISQTGKIISGGTPDTNDDDLWNGNVQWLTPTDITALKTHFIYDTPRKITDKGVKESSATLMPAGSLCVCTRASVGLMAVSTTPITTNQGFKSVVPNTKHDVEFLYYLFSFHRYVFIRYSSGSTFMELSKKDFAKITFNYPPLAEQEAIARVLASASDEIEQLEKRIAFLKQEKTALMQQLLTGKRRVNVDTEAA